MPLVFGIISLISEENGDEHAVWWVIVGAFHSLLNNAFTFFFALPSLDWVADELNIERLSDKLGLGSDDEVEEDNTDDNTTEETTDDTTAPVDDGWSW